MEGFIGFVVGLLVGFWIVAVVFSSTKENFINDCEKVGFVRIDGSVYSCELKK